MMSSRQASYEELERLLTGAAERSGEITNRLRLKTAEEESRLHRNWTGASSTKMWEALVYETKAEAVTLAMGIVVGALRGIRDGLDDPLRDAREALALLVDGD